MAVWHTAGCGIAAQDRSSGPQLKWRARRRVAAHPLEQHAHDQPLARLERTDVETQFENRGGVVGDDAGWGAAAASVSGVGWACGVVYQKNVVYEKVICQFSWACNGVSPVKPIYSALWKESEEVAKKVLLENFRLPSMKTAMYYHADYVNPQWGKPQITKIGRHIFYSEGKKI